MGVGTRSEARCSMELDFGGAAGHMRGLASRYQNAEPNLGAWVLLQHSHVTYSTILTYGAVLQSQTDVHACMQLIDSRASVCIGIRVRFLGAMADAKNS